MNYQHLFFDLDHTLWDFDTNARQTLSDLYLTLELQSRGVDDFDQFYKNYSQHNQKLWARYRKGHIQQKELRVKRMRLALLDFKIGDETLAETLCHRYLEGLPGRKALFPYTMEILEYLKAKNYQLHLITNGFQEVQFQKITHSGIGKYFDKVITSESSNSLKPQKEIFDYALKITGAKAAESIMLGDDMEADIMGASRAGLDQVYINHTGALHDFRPTYAVTHLRELEDIF
ncbi:YjjG family noncanonical pyrimidine nucleotidase [Niabella terrae]